MSFPSVQVAYSCFLESLPFYRGYQRIMVKAMTAAAAIPHFYLVDELKLDALVKLKNNLKDLYIEEGVKLTYLPLMIKALSVALLKYPLMNSTCNEDASTICCRGESVSEEVF